MVFLVEGTFSHCTKKSDLFITRIFQIFPFFKNFVIKMDIRKRYLARLLFALGFALVPTVWQVSMPPL